MQFSTPAANLPPVFLTPVPVLTTQAELVPKFAAGVVDTGGNFATGVIDTGCKFATGVAEHRWCTLTCEYLREFLKKFEMTLMLFSGAWGSDS